MSPKEGQNMTERTWNTAPYEQFTKVHIRWADGTHTIVEKLDPGPAEKVTHLLDRIDRGEGTITPEQAKEVLVALGTLQDKLEREWIPEPGDRVKSRRNHKTMYGTVLKSHSGTPSGHVRVLWDNGYTYPEPTDTLRHHSKGNCS
jgi:hypothetical protein